MSNVATTDVSRFFCEIAGRPAWGGDFRGGSEGFSLPSPDGLQIVPVTAEMSPWLKERGITVAQLVGTGHRIALHPDSTFKATLNFAGNNAALVIGRNTRLHSLNVTFSHGNGHVCIIGDSDGPTSVTATLRSGSAGLLIGARGSANGVTALCEGPGRSIQIGDDMMLSWRIELRTSDSHGIISLDDLESAINPPASIVIGPYVWLAPEVMVMKGCTIGRGSIVASRAVVTSDIPDFSLAAGVPARVIRSRVTWSRTGQPDKKAIQEALRLASGSGVATPPEA